VVIDRCGLRLLADLGLERRLLEQCQLAVGASPARHVGHGTSRGGHVVLGHQLHGLGVGARRRLALAFAIVLPGHEAGGGEHGGDREGDNEPPIFAPEHDRLIAPKVFIDFAKNVRHGGLGAAKSGLT